mgnify:CR=1 FL=1
MKNGIKFLITLLIFNITSATHAKSFSANVLAPNLVGQTENIEKNRDQWAKFETDLEKMKELGIQSISTHIWWSQVEHEDNKFDWSYYKRLSQIIIDKGMKWSPIISFNSCSDKDEESCSIELPKWVWSKYKDNGSVESIEDLKFISSDGNTSEEFISFWATDLVVTEYKDFIQSFSDNFQNKSSNILEIVISLGPSGELRYPIKNEKESMLQAYSPLAKDSYKTFIKSKYKTIDNVNAAWNTQLETINDIQPPVSNDFFELESVKSTYGKDFYDWYNTSLIEHGVIVLTTAIRVLNSEGSLFLNTPIGAIIPGSLWSPEPDAKRVSELNAGLIRSGDDIWAEGKQASGYEHIVSGLKEAATLTKFEFLNIHLTSIEMTSAKSDKGEIDSSNSLAFEISKLAKESNLGILGQNQSVNVLGSNQAWDNIWNAIQNANYTGLTIKTMNDISANPLAYDFYKWIIENMNE